ncbi:MAG: thiamine ABC transporter substrate-binding protein [Ilumatobacter sp.]|uniref:thiamine ABC transporter substrate-binding protein n=1 Tax=Ilumatobacter sp. TaxID=1967498 RepID=UPI003C7655A9
MSNLNRTIGVLVAAGLTLAACSSDDIDRVGSEDATTSTPGTDVAPSSAAPGPTTDSAAETVEDEDATATTEAAETTEPVEAAEVTETITLVVYESFPTEETPINDQLAAFTDETGIAVEILVAGDAGTMLSKAELTAGNPEGDVMWGIDNSFLTRAIASEIFEPYVADGLDSIDERFTALVPNGEATPVDFGDVCVNYDIAALEGLGVEPPTTLDDLIDPAYADLLVVQNPATSSPGLAFLLATIDEYGQDGWQPYWASLVDNGVSVTDGWTDAYYGEFTYAGGDRPLVVSYGSSPPFEVLFGEGLTEAPTGVVESTCFRQVEFAGVLAGTDQPDAARQLIDFLISEPFQAEVALNLFVFPVNTDVELDQTFTDFAVIPDESREVEPDVVDANREDWIDEWTDLVIG